MDDKSILLFDGQYVIRQIEEFYCCIPPHDDSLRNSSSPSRLTKKQQRRCTELIALVDGLLAHEAILQGNNNPSQWLRGHRQKLEDMLPHCRLMNLPAELREQIFSFAVTEWVPVPDEFVTIGTPPPRSVRVLQKRAIRIDRLNKPTPPGRRAGLKTSAVYR